MPTFTEHGYQGRGGNNIPFFRSVSQQPSRPWIDDFGTEYEIDPIPPKTTRTPAAEGKFVAVRNLLLLAPFPPVVNHRDIIGSRNTEDDLAPEIATQLQLAREEGIPLLYASDYSSRSTLTDAGLFYITRSQGQVHSILLTEGSGIFGRGDEGVREKTAELLRVALNGIEINY